MTQCQCWRLNPVSRNAVTPSGWNASCFCILMSPQSLSKYSTTYYTVILHTYCLKIENYNLHVLLMISNFSFLYHFCLTDHSFEIVASVPLSSICDVKKFSKKNLPKDKQMFLMDGFEILCSNIQSYRVSSLALISTCIQTLLTGHFLSMKSLCGFCIKRCGRHCFVLVK